MIIVYFLMLFALGTATESQEEVGIRIERSLKEPNWIMDKIKHPLEQVPYLNHMKHTSSRSLIRPKGATSSDDYAVFLKELSALGRILNGLTLDRQLRKGQLDVVQVVSEMAGVSVNQTLIDELAAAKWTDAEQAVQEVSTQLAGFSGATWQDQKITDGLIALGTLVDKVKPTAETLDVEKIKTVLEAVTELKSLDYTLLDGNPVAKILGAFQHLSTVQDPIPSSEEGKVMTSVTTAREQADVVEKMAAMIEAAHAKLKDINTKLTNSKQFMTPLFTCVDEIKNSGADGQKLTDFKTELGSFDNASKKLIALGASTQSVQASIPILEHYLTAFLSGHQMPIKYTLGLPHGLADLESLPSDLRLTRNQKLISGGGNLTTLETSFSRVASVTGTLKSTINDWKSYHTNKKDQSSSLDVLKSVVSGTTGFSSPTTISTFVDFVSNVQPILAFSTAQTTAGLGTAFDAWGNTLFQADNYLTSVTSRKDLLDRMKDLSALKQVLRSGRSSAESLTDFKGFKDLANVKESLDYLNNLFQRNINSKNFEKMKSSDNLITSKISELTTLKDWLVGVKEFQKPDGLDESLISTRKIVGDVQKLDAASLNSVKEVIVEAQKMKTSVESIRSQTTSKSRARRQVTIDGWTQLDALSSTIGHAVRSALVMSPTDGIGGKLEQLSKASKELDEVLKTTTDQSTRAEVENEWKGYGSIEAEVTVVQNQVKKVVESVPKKLESLKDLAVVVEKMTLVNMKFAKATAAAEAVKRIPTTTGDRNVKQKVEEVQKALDETLLAHMNFVSHHADLKMGADALDSISSFFASFFGIAKVQATVSTTPAEESGLGMMAYIGIGVAVLVVVVLAGVLLYCWFCRKAKRTSAEKHEKPSNRKPTPEPDVEKGPSANATIGITGTTAADTASSAGTKTKTTSGSTEPIAIQNSRESGSTEPIAHERRARSRERRNRTQTQTQDSEERGVKTMELIPPASETNVSMSDVRAATVSPAATPSSSTTNTGTTRTAPIDSPYLPTALLNRRGSLSRSVSRKPYVQNCKNFDTAPKYEKKFGGLMTYLDKDNTTRTAYLEIMPKRRRWVTNCATTWDRLMEEANMVMMDGASRHPLVKLRLHVDDRRRGEAYNFYEYKAPSGAELHAFKPTPEQYGAFLTLAFRWGVVSQVLITPWDAIRAGGPDRWWPNSCGQIIARGPMSVKLVAESHDHNETIYSAKLKIWQTDKPTEVSTVYLNALTEDIHPLQLISIDSLVRFHTRIIAAQYATDGGVILRYGSDMGQIGLMVAIHYCLHQITEVIVEPKASMNDVMQKIHECILTKEEYILVHLVIQVLCRESLKLEKSPELLALEKKFNETVRGELPLDPTMED